MLLTELKMVSLVLLAMVLAGGWFLSRDVEGAPGRAAIFTRGNDNGASGPTAPALATFAQDKPKSDKERLKGTWVAMTGERLEVAFDEAQLKKWVLVFDVESFTRGEGGDRVEGTFKIDADKKPKEIDLVHSGHTFLGIYELKGNTLKLVLKLKERPTEFNSKDATLLVCEKQK